MEHEEKIVAAFKASKVALSAGQVAEATGVERKEVDKVMGRLKKEGKLESPKVCYWKWKE